MASNHVFLANNALLRPIRYKGFDNKYWSDGMAGGFAKDGAVQDQIDATVEDAVRHARARLPKGKGLENCADCGREIPAARRKAIAGVRLCIGCQTDRDKAAHKAGGINRRGSKDSQLR